MLEILRPYGTAVIKNNARNIASLRDVIKN